MRPYRLLMMGWGWPIDLAAVAGADHAAHLRQRIVNANNQ
jgi:hypothetical protein